MSDIVERLRNPYTPMSHEWCLDAAEEIESLRQQLKEAQQKLLESQAREEKLRRMVKFYQPLCKSLINTSGVMTAEITPVDDLITNDSTALNERIAAEKKAVLLEAAELCVVERTAEWLRKLAQEIKP